MSDAKHTPGPWTVKGEIRPVGNPDQGGSYNTYCAEINPPRDHGYRGDVCRIQSCDHIEGITRDEAEANARLIAAAPDLLEALKLARNHMVSEGSAIAEICDAAIARATGTAT